MKISSTGKTILFSISLCISVLIFVLIWNYGEDPELIIYTVTGILSFQAVIMLFANTVGNRNKRN